MYKGIKNKELHNDLVVTWNEIEETLTSLKQLNNKEIIECLPDIKKRLENALHWLSKYVSNKDVLNEILK